LLEFKDSLLSSELRERRGWMMVSATLGRDAVSSEHPARFGRYIVVRELGQGGMARVFEGRHEQLAHRVALKVMQPALAAQPMAAARFLREAKAASQIRHQHVAQVFDIGTENGLPFIVMEFLEGSNLAALLAEKGPLSLSGIADVFLPVLSAVATAHASGIVHRDLKPANLMITSRPPRSMHPMVLDFGISKLTNDDVEGTLTRSESLLGTVQYMAPELTKGAKFASQASDQYALGVMLYECATGRRPFSGQSHYELMHAIVTAPVAPPSHFRADLPREFDAIVEKAMHRDPARRYPSVHALGSALLSFADKVAWAVWAREFVGSLPEAEPWASAANTLHDPAGPDHQARGARVQQGTTRGVRRKGWMPALLWLYAGTVTVLLARRSFERNEAVAAPAAGAAAIHATTSSRSDLRLADHPPTDHGEPLFGSGETSFVATPPSASAPLMPQNARVMKTGSARSRTSLQLEPSSRAAPAPTPQSEPTIVMGTNGAPIVE
jgi:eukaryotic-like serine/threonine-protein kinase